MRVVVDWAEVGQTIVPMIFVLALGPITSMARSQKFDKEFVVMSSR